MKPASPQFYAQLQSDVTTLCRLWRIEARGRDTIYLTDHDEKIEYNSNTYLAAEQTFQCSALDNQVGTGQTNFEIRALLGGVIIREECERGVFSGALIYIDAIFYDHVDYGTMPLATGKISGITLPNRHLAIFSCSGFASTGQHNLTEQYSPTCRAVFCDERCTLDIDDFTTTGCEVVSVSSTLTFQATGQNAGDGYYDLGFIVWTSGANEGLKSEVQHSNGADIRILIRPHFPIQSGDEFDIARGCKKTIDACTAYNNILNFRGEPYVPGDDFVNKPVEKKLPTTAVHPPTVLPSGSWVIPG